jgi:hypothetical protein
MDDEPREPVEPAVPDPVPPGRPRKRMYVAGAITLIIVLAGLIYWRHRSTHQPPPGADLRSA